MSLLDAMPIVFVGSSANWSLQYLTILFNIVLVPEIVDAVKG
jgi:hypothetical protein